MKVAIRYYSRTGSTRQLAKAIQEQLGVAAESIEIPVPNGVELLFLGIATYGGKTAGEVEDFISTLKGRSIRVVTFSSAVFRKSNFKTLYNKMKAFKIALLPENFYSGKLLRCLYPKTIGEKDLKQVKSFSREIVLKYL